MKAITIKLLKYPCLEAEVTPGPMKFFYDPIADVAHITLGDGSFHTSKELSERIVAEYDARGKVLGVEVLQPAKITPRERGIMKRLLPLRGFRPDLLVQGIAASVA